MPFKGTRYTAVAYKARNWKRIDLSLRTSLERLGVPVPRALPTPVRSVCTQSLPLRSIVIDLVINAILRGPDTNTSLSRLGTGQLNSPKFGIGRSILIHGLCQSGKSFEICCVAWLAAFIMKRSQLCL